MAKSQKIILKGLRSSYPHLFSKDTMSGKYTCDFIFSKDHPQVAELRAAINKVYADARANNPGKNISKDIIRDGDTERPSDAAFANCYYIKTKTSVDSIRNNVFKRTDMGLVNITDESEFYGGCNCEASLVVQWYEFQGKIGLHFLLNGVCQVPGGDAFGGSHSAKSDFGGDDEEEIY